MRVDQWNRPQDSRRDHTRVDASSDGQATFHHVLIEQHRKRANLPSMSYRFTASVTQEGSYFVAQCLEVDVASQGESLEAALENLREALVLRFEGEAPPPTLSPAQVVPFDVELQTR